VKELLITVQFVLLEELMLQNVLVQKDNMKMLTTNANNVTTNVKLVLLMMFVLNVLITLTEMLQVNVYV